MTTDRHKALANWLTANSINPNDVPIDADLTITTEPDGTREIRYEAFVRNSRGSITLDERGQTVVTEKRTARLLVEPPAWWQPYEKPTREQAIAERDQLAAVLREVLAEFRFETHPGRRCLQTGHIDVGTVERWRAALDKQ